MANDTNTTGMRLFSGIFSCKLVAKKYAIEPMAIYDNTIPI